MLAGVVCPELLQGTKINNVLRNSNITFGKMVVREEELSELRRPSELANSGKTEHRTTNRDDLPVKAYRRIH